MSPVSMDTWRCDLRAAVMAGEEGALPIAAGRAAEGVLPATHVFRRILTVVKERGKQKQ